MPGFGHAAMRALITEATGLVPDLPKTVGTGCGRRRPIAMTSTAPERVTSLNYLQLRVMGVAQRVTACGGLVTYV